MRNNSFPPRAGKVFNEQAGSEGEDKSAASPPAAEASQGSSMQREIANLAGDCTRQMKSAGMGNPDQCTSDGRFSQAPALDLIALGRKAAAICDRLKPSPPSGAGWISAQPTYGAVVDTDALNGTGSSPQLNCQWGTSSSEHTSDFLSFDIVDYSHAPDDEKQSAGVGNLTPVSGANSGDPNDYTYYQMYADGWGISIEAEAKVGVSPWRPVFPQTCNSLRAILVG